MRHSPLDAAHRALGARMVPFGGWEMPLAYDTGTVAEHLACRSEAVVFDVSHLGTVRVEGPALVERLQLTFTNDLERIEPGRAQYTHLLDDADGSVLDDIIVWWLEPEVADVMPNASNTERVVHALRPAEDVGDLVVRDTTGERVVLAVQGPAARDRLAAVLPEASSVGRFRVEQCSFAGRDCWIAGTGYTGGDGVEVAAPVAVASELWAAILDCGVPPAGLGARDTLRLEAGLPLHGHELGPGISPLNAGLGWVVGWDKASFRGRSALLDQQAAGVDPVLRGVRCEGRRPPRSGHEVLADGEVVGHVTSGNYSPVLGCGIALVSVSPGIDVGDEVVLRGPSADVAGECVSLPFVPA